jgi:vacuolar protein 8
MLAEMVQVSMEQSLKQLQQRALVCTPTPKWPPYQWLHFWSIFKMTVFGYQFVTSFLVAFVRWCFLCRKEWKKKYSEECQSRPLSRYQVTGECR